jgi:hypothetical protein
MNKTEASMASIVDLRRRVREVLPDYGDALLNLIDSLAAGPRIATTSEVALSPLCVFALSSLYTALRSASEATRAGTKQAEEFKRLLKRVRRARQAWLDRWGKELGVPDSELGHWRVLVLDTTNYPRPKAPTVARSYVHGADGMRPGHALSVLSERVAPGSWTLPLEIELVPVGQAPAAFGARQLVDFIASHGFSPEDVVAIDAGFTNVPTLRPMVEATANLVGRISGRRVLFRAPGPPPAKPKRGRPRIYGAKVRLWDQRTLPVASQAEQVVLEDGRRFEVSRYDDLRMRGWPEQRVSLYRVIEYRADGRARFKRPLWLIYVGAAEAPAPRHARAIYGARFSIEHAFRFLKRELGLVSGQFNGEGAIEREQLWVELVATAMWELFAMREQATGAGGQSAEKSPTRPVTPGAVRKQVVAIFTRLGIERPKPVSRGKSPGRVQGTDLEPRTRYKIFRKRKSKRAA